MAVKDHTLDDKLIKAARSEFLQHGFRRTSLHSIVEKAGITTGALYTRYKNKDELFCSLIKDVMEEIGRKSEPMRAVYMEARETRSAEKLLEAIRQEKTVYLDMMFQYYDECVLLFCRSGGSSVETMIQKMTEQKSRETVEFMKELASKNAKFDASAIEFIMAEQFNYYRLVLERGYTKEKAISCMEEVERFLEAGWKDLFERIM